MNAQELVDAQFDHAVKIVQGLPKTGPIQTGYEEKLTMYSLYKQASVGNVTGTRPPIWDMLGRAKWDAWQQHKEMDSNEAKSLYVDALIRVLRRYSDKTVARELVKELESFGVESSRTMTRSRARSDSISSSSSESTPPLGPGPVRSFHSQQLQRNDHGVPVGLSEDERDDERTNDGRLLPRQDRLPSSSHLSSIRPQSSLSTQRYRTPMGGSLAMSSPPIPIPQLPSYPFPHPQVPAVQPMPGFETPTAFPDSSPAPTIHASVHRHPLYPVHPSYGSPQQYSAGQLTPGALESGSRSPIERAVESVQSHLVALQERIDVLEASALEGSPHHSRTSLGASQRGGALSRSGLSGGRRPSPNHKGFEFNFDLEHMGMWRFVLSPLVRITRYLSRVLSFILHRDGTLSPGLVIFRRLLLDTSFVLCMMAIFVFGWRRSGVRRSEVFYALKGLWRAFMGIPPGERVMIDRSI